MAIMLDKAKREIAGVSVSSKETEVGLPENRPFPDSEHESVSVPFSENNENNFHRRSQEESSIRDNSRSQRSFRDNAWE
jgi:hypothetical protein